MAFWVILSKRFIKLSTFALSCVGGFAVLAFISSVVWVYVDREKPDPWVNLFTLLSVIFAALAAIWVSMQSRIEGDYSLCFALAHGYVNNFVKYALVDLQKLSPAGGQFVIFHNYCIIILKTFNLFLNLSISLIYHSTRLYLFLFASFNQIQSNFILSYLTLFFLILPYRILYSLNLIILINLIKI